MKIKELNTFAHIAWSPSLVKPIYLACGTSAQQLDASFNSSSVLQIYDLNTSNDSLDMKLVSTKETQVKFNKILWSGGKGESENSHGIIVGGCNNRSIYIYSAEKLIKNEESLITSMDEKHAGPVSTLDFNFHQPNLLASGSSDCEILIWDINDTSSPMTPGTKPNMTCDVNEVAWNKQVEHILAATYGGRCVVYDLRKSAPIIQITESVSRMKAHSVKWHPSVATQMILGSDDDTTALGQVWDLRFATSPLKALQGHQRGIVSTAWCLQDPDLFITSAKDNKMFVWDPNTKEQHCEIVGMFPSYNQWAFDVDWCESDPSLVAASSVDGTVSIYSVLGAGTIPTQVDKFSAIADSFPGMEMPAEIPGSSQPQSIYLKRPPKWFPKRCGANFAFGGRLVSFNSSEKSVSIQQIVTDPEFLATSSRLQEALAGDLVLFCQEKANEAAIQHEKTLWNFIGASFSPSVRTAYISLLGFPEDETAEKESLPENQLSPEDVKEKKNEAESNLEEREEVVKEMLNLSVTEKSSAVIRRSLLVGDYDSAVSLCLSEKKTSLALIVAAHAGTELYCKTRDKVLENERESGLSSLVRCVVQHDLHSLVSECELSGWKEALVAVLTYASDEELLSLAEFLGDRLESEGELEYRHSALLCFLCAGSLNKFVTSLAKIKRNSLDGTPADLQEMIEIMVVLERALFALGKSQHPNEGNVYFFKYASLLASQGALPAALSYLNNPIQDDIVELRNRLHRAMNHQPDSAHSRSALRNRSLSASSQNSMRRSSTPISSFQPSTGIQPMATVCPSFTAPNTAPQTHLPPMPMPVESVPASRLPAGGLRRSNIPKRSFQDPTASLDTSAAPPSAPPAAPPVGMFNPLANIPRQHVQPNSHFPNTNQPSSIPPTGMPPPAYGSGPPSFSLASSDPGSSSVLSPDSPGTPENTMTPAAFDSTIPRGWNDPPPLSASRKLKQRQKSASGSTGDANTAPIPGMMVPEQPQQIAAPAFQQPHMAMNPDPRSGGFVPATLEKPPVVHSPAPPKAPLPEDHQVIQDVFNKLLELGMQATVNPAMKQRLEDLVLKLEVLYEKIRTGKIGANTVSGLHQIVEAAKCGDYHQALQQHAATISTGNFSEMSQFMPAVKILLTACMQCQVFYN